MKLKKALSLSLIAVTSLFMLTGCGNKKQKDVAENTAQDNNTQSEQTKVEQTQDENKQTNKQPMDMKKVTTASPQKDENNTKQNVASQYYLSLGTLDKKVAIEGNNRDRDDFEILNGKIIFPIGYIHSVVVRENEGKEHFINASEKEVKSFINTIENTKCKTKVTANPDKKSEVVLVYKTNEDNDYHTIYIESAENNHYIIKVKEDDREEFAEAEDIEDRQSGQEYKTVQIKSKKLAKIIKKWMV